jgi:antibiotic biosynthesis monooxygenase (ABM) superfamily enzyme
MNEPIHVAITRRVKPGCEAEFQQALHEFIQASFSHDGVLGAGILVPPAGSEILEYGVLRTFQSEQERDAFYESAVFKAWEERVKPLVEGEPTYRKLHGLEAWFRNPNQPNPPEWKMALLTFVAVWPVSMAVPALLNPLIGQKVPNVIFAGAVAAGIVLVLTWVAMPVLVKLTRHWLRPKTIKLT